MSLFNLKLWSNYFNGGWAVLREMVAPHFLSMFPSQHPHACTGLSNQSFSGEKNSIKKNPKWPTSDHLCCPPFRALITPLCPATPWIQYPQTRCVNRIPCLNSAAQPVNPGLHQYKKKPILVKWTGLAVNDEIFPSPIQPRGKCPCNSAERWLLGLTHPFQPNKYQSPGYPARLSTSCESTGMHQWITAWRSCRRNCLFT